MADEGEFPKEDGNILYASDVNKLYNRASKFKNFMQLIYNETYEQDSHTNWNSKLNCGTGSPDFNNLIFDTFLSDSADVRHGFYYNSSDKYYYIPEIEEEPYVIIEADDETRTYASNDCILIKIGVGKWLLICTDGTYEVKRAKLMYSLFHGDYGGLIAEFSNVSALKTSVSRDVGKRGYFNRMEMSTNSTFTIIMDGTFVNTTDNNDCSSWSRCYADSFEWTYNYADWEIPIGSLINRARVREDGPDTVISDHFNTDRTEDELDNPAHCRLKFYHGTGSSQDMHLDIRTIILAKGGLTFETTGNTPDLEVVIDYYTDYNIPDFTAANSISEEAEFKLIFKNIVSENSKMAVVTWNSDLNTNNAWETSISFNAGSDYTICEDSIHVYSNNSGTNIWLKFEMTAGSDFSTEQKISEFGIYHDT
jgi:hypothetical protein